MTLKTSRTLYFTLTLLLLYPASRLLPAWGAETKTQSKPTIHVDAAQVLNRITPYMYGSCIEDVNHEIYGGLYAQRIFGESFEEPPTGPPLKGWSRYGGNWAVRDGALTVEPDAGAKLVRDTPEVGDGEVSCEVRLRDRNGGNAGLVLRVQNPRTGADTWTGYEVSLSARDQTLHFSRHRENWQPLQTVPAQVEPGRWHRLRVEMRGPTLRIFVDDATKPTIEHTDGADAVLTGRVGLRTWQSDAAYRNLRIKTAGEETTESLAQREPENTQQQVSGMWDRVRTGDTVGAFSWDSAQPFHGAHAQRIERGTGNGTVGVANRGLNRWGIAYRKGARYAGHLWLRAATPLTVTVALQSADGAQTYGTQRLKDVGADWTRRDFTLTSSATDPNARFALWIDAPGILWVDQAYLSGTGRDLFRGGPFRADIGEKLVQQGLTFLRYGGTMVNAPEYRWKKMIGDRDRRPPYRGHWYPQSTNGFGIEEFLQFCELARITPAFAINIEETPEDAADLVEYLNGSVTTPWGRKRAENGHPKPYNLRYIEIGNEEAIGDNRAEYTHYLERFESLYAAMRPKDPSLQFVISAWWRPEEPLCRTIAIALKDKAALWDVHVGGDGLRDGMDADRTFTQMKRLFAEWIPGSALRACVFEENGNRHDLQRALGHAAILNATQRHGDFVLMDCPANCLQPHGQNDNGWNQGQVFFTPSQVWGMPPYYTQQMARRNHLPLRVESQMEGIPDTLDVTATRSEDGKTLVLKVVNIAASPQKANLQLAGFTGVQSRAEVWTLSGDLQAINTPAAPEQVTSRKSTFDGVADRFDYTFPAYSYTILRLQR